MVIVRIRLYVKDKHKDSLREADDRWIVTVGFEPVQPGLASEGLKHSHLLVSGLHTPLPAQLLGQIYSGQIEEKEGHMNVRSVSGSTWRWSSALQINTNGPIKTLSTCFFTSHCTLRQTGRLSSLRKHLLSGPNSSERKLTRGSSEEYWFAGLVQSRKVSEYIGQ
jgi:hypothetical protein